MTPWVLRRRVITLDDGSFHYSYVVRVRVLSTDDDGGYLGRVRKLGKKWTALLPGLVDHGRFPTRREAVQSLYTFWVNDPNNRKVRP